MNIYLIGYRATGKSRVGRQLSAMLGLGFVDMDAELTGRMGTSIREFVARSGWPAFRHLEKMLLEEVHRREHLVVATGGGVVLDEGNTRGMRRHGRVVWLTTAPGTIQGRMLADPGSRHSRPPLTDAAELSAEIERTLAERLPLYRRAADFSVDTDGLTVEEACRAIAAWLRAQNTTAAG